MVGCHYNSHNAVQLLLSHHRFEEVLYLCTVRSSKSQKSKTQIKSESSKQYFSPGVHSVRSRRTWYWSGYHSPLYMLNINFVCIVILRVLNTLAAKFFSELNFEPAITYKLEQVLLAFHQGLVFSLQWHCCLSMQWILRQPLKMLQQSLPYKNQTQSDILHFHQSEKIVWINPNLVFDIQYVSHCMSLLIKANHGSI